MKTHPVTYKLVDGFFLCCGFNETNFRETCQLDPGKFQEKSDPGPNSNSDPQPIVTRFVVTYPKCGTTWTQMIISLLASGGAEPTKAAIGDVFFGQPFLELMGVEGNVDRHPRPVALKTHLPFNYQPRSSWPHQERFLYVVRNPKDTAVSWYYHHITIECLYDIDWNDYIDCFLDGTIGYGDYFDHVTSWWLAAKEYPERITFLTYEDMKKDPKRAIRRVADFLGPTYVDQLDRDPGMIDRIVKFSSFEYMKQLDDPLAEADDNSATLSMGGPGPGPGAGTGPEMPIGFRRTMMTFEEMKQKYLAKGIELNKATSGGNRWARKGQVNDWKNHFTPEQNERMRGKFVKYATQYGIDKIWSNLDWL